MSGDGPSGAPVWIPSAGGPLAGWFHTPTGGRARGAVLLCPPLGLEHMVSYRPLRAMAERLAAEGLCALRFDYPGTGDSVQRCDDEGTVAAWQEGLGSAVTWLRARRAPLLALLGMRMGALLAAAAAAGRHDVDALVLWDPCLSGRHFLREQRALRLVTLPDVPVRSPVGIEAPGFTYGPRTVSDIGRLDARPLSGQLPTRTVLLSRSDEARQDFIGAGPWEGDTLPAADQGRFLDCSSVLAVEPTATVARIEAWLHSALAGPEGDLEPWSGPDEATVSAPGDEVEVVERPRFLGAARLFALHTVAPDRTEPDLPTVVLLNVAEDPHIGPGRLWVDLARTLSRRGFEVLRLDFNGVGDSPARPGRLQFPAGHATFLTDRTLLPEDELEAERVFPNPSFDQGNLDDIVDVEAALERPVVLVGLCSGAYHAIEMGASLPAVGVVAINPLFDFTPPEMRAGLPMDPRRRASTPRREWANTVKDRRIGALARRFMPDAGWRLIDLLRLQPSPVNAMLPLAGSDAISLVMCNEHDAEPFLERGAQVLRRINSRPNFTFRVEPGLDHALLDDAGRRQAAALVEEFLVATFVDVVGASTSGRAGRR